MEVGRLSIGELENKTSKKHRKVNMTSRNAIGKYRLLKRAEVLYYDGSFLENEFEFNVILWIYPRPSNSGK